VVNPIPTNALKTDAERQLIKHFRDMGEADQRTLLDFAEFLAQRSEPETQEPVPAPEPIPRPEEESVVRAVKRLSRTYHMLDKSKMLNETSSLVAQHVMQGRPAQEVIDELEYVFERHYRRLTGDDE